MEYIKINLPNNEDSYISGNGEGCWALVDEETKIDYDNNNVGEGFTAILDNNSIYYPGLMAGTKIPFEMRGKNRPVVPYQWLVDNYRGNQ